MSDGNGKLPDGWEFASLGDVTSPSTEKAEPRTFGDSKYLGLENIESGTNRIVGSSDVESAKSTKAVFRAGDVLYGKLRPYLNKVCRPNFNGVCSTDILVYPEFAELDNGYLLHFLSNSSTTNYATQNASGINLPRVSAKVLSEINFPLPPLAEQRRIVAKIEALQERSRNAREALAEVGPLLEQFRQSLLAAAFRGDLTADWRAAHPHVEPASELLARIRKERRQKWEQAELAKYKAKGKQPPKGWQDKYTEPEPVDDSELPELPEGWCWGVMEDLCTEIVDCPHSTPKWTKSGKICVRTTEFRAGRLDLTKVQFVSDNTFEERIKRLRPESGDVLYSREGGILGIACQIPVGVELCLGQRMMLMRPESRIKASLVMHWLNSPYIFLDRVQSMIQGAASPHINVGEVKRFPCPIAPIREQAELDRLIKEGLNSVDSANLFQFSAQSDLSQLDQSILAKAFRGELVPQDPNDEPASVLLERIRAERDVQDAKKNNPKRKRATRNQ